MRYWLILALPVLAACQPESSTLSGYVEGEYVRVAAAQAGRLQQVLVQSGDAVPAGQPLFTLDTTAQQQSVAAAAAQLAQREAEQADLAKGQRAPELARLQAEVKAAEAAVDLAQRDWQRQQSLSHLQYVSTASLDAARNALHQAQATRDAQVAALQTARLASRDDQRTAARAARDAAAAELAQARWQQQQQTPAAPTQARVEEVLYRAGEWVPAGSPVVTLLPPENIKVRFYIPEPRRSQIHTGDRVQLLCDSCRAPIAARISFIADSVEYTPPVIYSKENRARQVFLAEARPLTPTRLAPGLPLDVVLEPGP